MSPSGSRMQTWGTCRLSMPFCRRASLSRASGVKTDGASTSLRRRIGGCPPLSSFPCAINVSKIHSRVGARSSAGTIAFEAMVRPQPFDIVAGGGRPS
jgi:hypothetical protein